MTRLGKSFITWVLLRIAVPSTMAFTTPSSSGRRIGCLEVSSANDAAPSKSQSATPTPLLPELAAPTRTFTSPTFSVYIEDTDAYGVMYNSNYLRSYERALSHVPRENDEDAIAASSDGDTKSQQSEEDDDGRWILSFITNQKFRSSPALGEEYVIRGDLVERTSSHKNDVEVWQLEMVTQNNKDLGEDGWIIHNSAAATLTRAPKKDATAALLAPLFTIHSNSNNTTKLAKMFERRYTPYHDEFDMHYHHHYQQHPQQAINKLRHGYHIPLRNAMNFFERSRTSYLGGPDVLRKMQVEDDILWVVTGIDDGKLLLDSIALEHYYLDDDDEKDGGVSLEEGTLDLHPTPGREVIVQTSFIAKRRGMIVDCQHRLYMDVNSNDGQNVGRRLLAQATVTIMALKGSTRRPTSKLPQWLLDRFMM